MTHSKPAISPQNGQSNHTAVTSQVASEPLSHESTADSAEESKPAPISKKSKGSKQGHSSKKKAEQALVQEAKASSEHRSKSDSKAASTLPKLTKKRYKSLLAELQVELVKLQEWVKHKGLKVVVIFEGRDAAGKGSAIKRITAPLNPRICRVVALGTPTEREKSQWYFQRYVAHLPAAGEMVLFDRSWYNRAGVERVMGFCTHAEYIEFIRSCPEFEHMLQRSGIILVKYWFSVNDEEQERRFQKRIDTPTKRWKLSPMDLESRARWVDYSKAKDDMFAATDTTRSPWYVVEADDKKRARLNCINHLLGQVGYQDLTPKPIKLPKRQKALGYERPTMDLQNIVPDILEQRAL